MTNVVNKDYHLAVVLELEKARLKIKELEAALLVDRSGLAKMTWREAYEALQESNQALIERAEAAEARTNTMRRALKNLRWVQRYLVHAEDEGQSRDNYDQEQNEIRKANDDAVEALRNT